MVTSIFQHTHYRQLLQERLTAEGRRGQLSKAAAYLNCQPSFLSRVMSGEIDLTLDHAFRLAQFWSLEGDERQFFLKLVECERAGDNDYRRFLKSQIDEIVERNSEIGARTRRTGLATQAMTAKYFSSWLYGAVHFLTCVESYQTSHALSQRLNVSEELMKEILGDLEAMGFVEARKGRWLYKAGEFHLERTNPLVILHHQNWRQRAILDAQNFAQKNVHFSMILTMSKKDFELVQQKLIDMIAEVNRIAGPSRPEEAAVLNLDFFRP